MHNGYGKKTSSSKKSTSSSGGGGGGKEWGYFDSLAKASNPNTSVKDQKEAVKQANSIARSQGWDDRDDHKQAVNNAELMYQGEQTAKQIEAEEAAKADQVVTTTDGGVTTTDGVVPKVIDKKKKVFTVGNKQVSERLYKLYQRLLDRGYTPEDAKKIIKLGVTEEKWADENLTDLMSGEGIKKLGSIASGVGGIVKGALTKPPYENEFLGSAGAANILNKLNAMPDGTPKEKAEKQAYVNRILAENKGAEKIFGPDLMKGNITPDKFEEMLKKNNQGNKNFDKNYHETAGAYWELNPPTTQGDMVDLANASRQEGFEWTKQNTQMVQEARELASRQGQGLAGLGGGGGGGTQPVDPTDPDIGLMPSGTYLASQYNKALIPDPNLDPYQNAMYTSGIEQQHLAGGYWDPNAHQWLGSPWGTQNLWQGANPTSPPITTMAEGGPVRAPSSKVTQGGGGLFDFKPYGF